jgi:4-amino-4-deoxy-L-arabinose transferase-like glycosyltransferase
VTLALGLAYLALVEEEGRWWAQLFWASQGLVFLAKGLVGPVMVVLPVGVVLACLGDRRKLAAFLRPGWGMAVGLALALAWVVPLALAGGREYLMEVFVRNSLGRFFMHPELVSRTGRLDEHREPFHFYLARTPGNLLPWLGLWGVAMARGLAKGLARGRRFGVAQWCLPVFFLVTLVLLTVSSAKRMVYLLPVLPATFLHAALWLDAALEEPSRPGLGAWGALWGSVVLVMLLGTVLPWFVLGRVGLAWPVALCMSLPAFLLGLLAIAMAARRLPGPAMAWSMTQWVVTLLAFLLLAVPELDKEWSPILEPYREARKLELLGAQVHEGRLGEGQVGLVNLTFGHRLPPVATPEAVREALARPEPVAVLLESRHFWKGALQGRVQGAIEIPFEALSTGELWDRAPVLLLNPEALELLVGGRDEEAGT